MKNSLILIFFFVSFFVITACGNKSNNEKQTKEIKSEMYQCPMKCSEQKFDKAGNCPVCGMELVKINNS